MKVPLSKIYRHFATWVWPNKFHFIIFISIVLLLGSSTFFIAAQISQQQQSSPSEPVTATPPEEPAKTPETDTPDTTVGNPNTAQPTPPDFTIHKVFFREHPSTPSGAEEGNCSEGQNITFPVSAEVTHTGDGTARYHWEVNPRDGSVQKTPDETVKFSESGVTKINATLSYTITDTSSLTGLAGPAFQNRLHINLVFNEPNLMYANKEVPYYGTGSFIWGTYLDICDS